MTNKNSPCIYSVFTLLVFISCSKCPLNQPSPKWYYIYIAELDSTSLKKKIQISYLEMNKSSNIVRTDSVSLPYYNSVYYTYSDCKYPAPFLQVNNDGVALKAFIDNDIVKLKDGCSISSVFEPANAVGDCSYLKNYSIDSVFAYEKKVKYPGYMEMLSGDKNKIVYLPDWTWKASP